MDDDPLARPLTLPCGMTLPNRIAKAAMTEGLADPEDQPTARHERLYGRWADGGVGLAITGNIMIDRRFLERAGNVVLDQSSHLDAFRAWAAAGTRNGARLFAQLNHPGRQCTRASSRAPVAPSAVGLDMMGLFSVPRALEEHEIRTIIRAWANAARLCQEAGFSGVQIHAAHGYLVSQFLSPMVNLRTDEWGGPLDQRARFLLETVRAVRRAVGPRFPVAVKLNSSDFQRGGFTAVESATVARWLADEGIDLLELSGGTYEALAFMGDALSSYEGWSKSTKAREAFFLDYAHTVRDAAPGLPMMVTGGFRSSAFMRAAVRDGELDLVGIARPFCLVPDLAAQLLARTLDTLPTPERDLRLGPGALGPTSESARVRGMNSQAEVAFFYAQLIELAEGRGPRVSLGARRALLEHVRGELSRSRARKFQSGT
ncbi:MAG: NADH:flavin oxidoreductase/NADH oxidase family protein [Myxococcales bacterium]|nr:NADH:flavin oxidoreductase/NADH oxidase family protein [Myxococcales bacterium]